MMRKKIYLTLLLIVLPFICNAQNENKEEFNWDSTIEAIIEVETKGNVNAKSNGCWGPMQITKGLVDDVNQFIGKKKYTYQDRLNLQKSKEIFILYQKRYNPTNNIEKAIRIWNGGPKYSVSKTNRYYKKVMRAKKN